METDKERKAKNMSNNSNNYPLAGIRQPNVEADDDTTMMNSPIDLQMSDEVGRARDSELTNTIPDQMMVDNNITSNDEALNGTPGGFTPGNDSATPLDIPNIFQQLLRNQFGVNDGDNEGPTGIEALFGGVPNQRERKKATENAISHLKHLDAHELEDKNCSICYEPYDDDNKQPKFTDSTEKRLEPLDNDPEILFPTDATGKKYSHFKKPLPLANDEHTPVEMPCKHVFGKSCLIEWLKNHNSCPLCRKEVESQPISGKEKIESFPRRFVPADWSGSLLTSDDPSIPLPDGGPISFGTSFVSSDGATVAFQVVNNLARRYVNE